MNRKIDAQFNMLYSSMAATSIYRTERGLLTKAILIHGKDVQRYCDETLTLIKKKLDK